MTSETVLKSMLAVIKHAVRCGTCGGHPEVEVRHSDFQEAIEFLYRCHAGSGFYDHAVIRIDGRLLGDLADLPQVLHDARVLDPFPLTKESLRERLKREVPGLFEAKT